MNLSRRENGQYLCDSSGSRRCLRALLKSSRGSKLRRNQRDQISINHNNLEGHGRKRYNSCDRPDFRLPTGRGEDISELTDQKLKGALPIKTQRTRYRGADRCTVDRSNSLPHVTHPEARALQIHRTNQTALQARSFWAGLKGGALGLFVETERADQEDNSCCLKSDREPR